MGNKLKKTILLFGDIVVLYFSLYLTLIIRFRHNPSQELWQAHFAPFTIAFFGWLIIFYIAGLYDLKRAVNNAYFFKTVIQSSLAAVLVSVIFFYLYPISQIAPKTNLAIFIVVFVILFIFWRRIFNWALKSHLPKINIAFVGNGEKVAEIIKELKQKPHLGFNVSFILQPKSQSAISLSSEQAGNKKNETNGVPVFDDLNQLYELVSQKKINCLILASDPEDSLRLRSVLFDCLPLKVNYINLPNFYETITGKIPVEAINQTWFLENLNEGNRASFDAIKRIYDLILAFLIFTLTLPLWLIIALAIKLNDRGKIFFIQIRIGRNGRSFKIIKFRTMRESENDYSPTEEKDGRITRLGNFLRKSRLDELPQLLNIIKGEMSFVGPRPERPELIINLEGQIPFYKERMLVKPGVTGADQISGEYHSPSYEDTMKKLQYDLFYIKNRSVYLDLSIILKTISTVLSRAGR